MKRRYIAWLREAEGLRSMRSWRLVAYVAIWVTLGWALKRRYQVAMSQPVRIVAASGLILITGYLVMSQLESFFEDEEVRLTLMFLLRAIFARLRLRQ